MKTEELDIRRRMISYKTMSSWQEIPHVSYTYRPDATALNAYFRKIKAELSESGVRLTLNSLMLKLIAGALKEAPLMYSTLEVNPDDLYSGRISTPDSINIGIPWTIPGKGMMTFTLRNAGNLSITEISAETEKIARKLGSTDIDGLYRRIALEDCSKAKPDENMITPYDFAGSSITVSNIGSICRYPGSFDMLDILSPQTCVIGISALQDDVRPVDGEIKAVRTLPVTIVFDHRAIDFGDIMPFLDRLDSFFKNPQLIEALI